MKFTKKLPTLSSEISLQNTGINLTWTEFTELSRDEYKLKLASTTEDKVVENLEIKNASEAAEKK